MKIRLKSVSTLLRQHTKATRGGQYKTPDDKSWRRILRAIGGRLLTVDTRHLFAGEFNTVAVPGVTAIGIRISASQVRYVKDDLRPQAARCEFCGTTYLGVADKRIGATCPDCNQGKVRRLGELLPKPEVKHAPQTSKAGDARGAGGQADPGLARRLAPT